MFAALAGCATGRDPAAEARLALRCHDKAQCDRYWQRAQDWVAKNSEYKIRTVTDWVIMTESPGDFGIAAAYTITKTPTDDGGAAIALTSVCSNFIPCLQSHEAVVGRFNSYVAAP
jgi:hypothetical protein